MKLLPLIAALCLAASTVHAADDKAAAPAEKKLTPAQTRMADCNKQAGDKRGAERRDFMRNCMHDGKPPALPAKAAPAPAAAPAPTPAAAAPAPAPAATAAAPAPAAKPDAAPAAPAAKVTPQDRMRNCNQEATGKGLKGPDRRDFMKGCLKSK